MIVAVEPLTDAPMVTVGVEEALAGPVSVANSAASAAIRAAAANAGAKTRNKDNSDLTSPPTDV